MRAAQLSGINAATIQAWEHGRVIKPPIHDVMRLAKVLRISTLELQQVVLPIGTEPLLTDGGDEALLGRVMTRLRWRTEDAMRVLGVSAEHVSELLRGQCELTTFEALALTAALVASEPSVGSDGEGSPLPLPAVAGGETVAADPSPSPPAPLRRLELDPAQVASIIARGMELRLPADDIADSVMQLAGRPTTSRAVGHPTRVGIVDILRRRGQASVLEIAADLDATPSSVEYHVKALTRRGRLEEVDEPAGGHEHRSRLAGGPADEERTVDGGARILRDS